MNERQSYKLYTVNTRKVTQNHNYLLWPKIHVLYTQVISSLCPGLEPPQSDLAGATMTANRTSKAEERCELGRDADFTLPFSSALLQEWGRLKALLDDSKPKALAQAKCHACLPCKDDRVPQSRRRACLTCLPGLDSPAGLCSPTQFSATSNPQFIAAALFLIHDTPYMCAF